MKPWGEKPNGRLEEHVFVSDVLRGNPLGDPFERPLWVYVPPGYDAAPDRRYPSVYLLQGLTGQIDMWRSRDSFRPNSVELVDELFSRPDVPGCIVVFVDCWTSLGGSQFRDSPATGNYHTYLCDEVVAWVDSHYRTLAAPQNRGISGKSSGGYGAMITPMLRPDVFGGLATIAGDSLFEVGYLPDFRKCARALRDEYSGSFSNFWEDFRSRPAFTKNSDIELLNIYCMAACYSADADGTVRLPFEIETGRLIPEVWERWLQADPVRMVPEYADALRSMTAIYIVAGSWDEEFLDLGAEAFREALTQIGVTDVYFELFDAGHRSIEYRYPHAIEYLARKLSLSTDE
jgi:hypothetical protein